MAKIACCSHGHVFHIIVHLLMVSSANVQATVDCKLDKERCELEGDPGYANEGAAEHSDEGSLLQVFTASSTSQLHAAAQPPEPSDSKLTAANSTKILPKETLPKVEKRLRKVYEIWVPTSNATISGITSGAFQVGATNVKDNFTNVKIYYEAMSPTEKWNFIGIYASLFLVLAVLVNSIMLCRSLCSDKSEENGGQEQMGALEADNRVIEHGQAAHLPSEPVTEQVLARARELPTCIALVAAQKEDRQEYTYEDLAGTIRSLAENLMSLGVGSGSGKAQLVLLALDRGVHQVAAVYSVMHCGAAWVPIDPAVPQNRFIQLLEESHPVLVLHQADAIGSQISAWCASTGALAAALSFDASSLQCETTHPKVTLRKKSEATADMEACALIIYTSGTTGKPKGIMYSHAMLNHGANAVGDLMDMSCGSVGFLKTPYIWAVVEWEFFPALVRGGTLVVGSANVHKEPHNMAETIMAEQVTSLVMAPDVLDLLLDIHEQGSQLQSLKHVISVGAGLPVSLANKFASMSGFTARLHNVYGASESSCTVYTVPQGGVNTRLWSNRAPVGVPQMGCSVWVMDDKLEPVPAGSQGELCFGGQLCLGYFNLPELTAQKFIVHPEFGRIYRTGDVARWRQGVLEICGRQDRQVKIRGVRIELEEVESALANYGGLQQVACIASTGSSPELVAFLSPNLDDAQITQVREHLKKMLPSYYLPKHIIARDQLPKLPNGKVALPMLVEEANNVVDTSTEEVLDSLGQMRAMSGDMILENQVIQRCYAYWMVGVIIDHWMECDGPTGCLVLFKAGVPSWVELFARQIGNDQDMVGFLMLGALQASRPGPGEKEKRLTLGYAELFLFNVYILSGFPIPQLSRLLLGDLIDKECGNHWSNLNCSGHRWYLFLILWAHVSIAFCQRLRIPAWLQVLGHFALCFPNEWFDPCNRLAWGHWLFPKWILSYIFPWGGPFTYDDYCPINRNWLQMFAMMYVAFFYYSRPCMKLVTGAISRLGLNSRNGALAAWGASSVIGALISGFHYPNLLFEPHDAGKTTMRQLGVYLLELVGNTLQPALLALAMAWCPFDLSFWGGTTLGTYIFHFYFSAQTQWILQGLNWLQPFGGLPQLLFVLAVPLTFMTTVGPLFHHLLTSPRFIADRLANILRMKASKASKTDGLNAAPPKLDVPKKVPPAASPPRSRPRSASTERL